MKKKTMMLALCAAVCLSLASCGNEGSSQSAAGSNSQSGSETSESTFVSSQSTNNSENESSKGESPVLTVGETANLGNWSISVTGFEFSSRIEDGYSYFDPNDGSQFGVVSASVSNNGTEADSFLPSFGYGDDVGAKIIYNSQYEYTSTQLLAYDADLHDEFLNPLSSASGVIVFELPETVVNGTESLTIEFTSGADVVTFSLR